jgi:hypothetical protein
MPDQCFSVAKSRPERGWLPDCRIVNDLHVTAPLEERKMKRSTKLSAALTIALLTMVVASASADEQLRTRLIGYEETPLTINSPARGEFRTTIGAGGAVIEYELTYRNLSSPVT